ncbi:MAG: tetratricopeptide repeat protein [Actinomycetaceae bacterium]|nr:tetratricopeptide repeat protein [Actinomycetaceae bacterium]
MADQYGAVELNKTESQNVATPTADTVEGPWITDVTEATFDQMVALSMQVPVVLDLWATWCGPCKQLSPVLEDLANQYQGRFQLAKVDIDANPAVAKAFQVQSVPAVFLMLGGRPMPLFTGAQPRDQIRAVLEQVLQMAEKSGVTMRLSGGGEGDAPLSPEQQEINALIEVGDIAGAKHQLQKVIEANPSDESYKAQLAELEWQERLQKAGDDPLSRADQMLAAGNDAAAFDTLLEALVAAQPEDKDQYRARIVELFRLSTDKKAVTKARTRLATLLF